MLLYCMLQPQLESLPCARLPVSSPHLWDEAAPGDPFNKNCFSLNWGPSGALQYLHSKHHIWYCHLYCQRSLGLKGWDEVSLILQKRVHENIVPCQSSVWIERKFHFFAITQISFTFSSLQLVKKWWIFSKRRRKSSTAFNFCSSAQFLLSLSSISHLEGI